MSQQNVEFVRDMCEAFVAGDFERALSGLDAEVVWHGTIGGLDEGSVVRGRQQVIAAFGESRREWASHRLEAQRFTDAGDSVVVFWHEQGRGLRSGVEVATDTAAIFTVRERRIVEVRGFMDRSAALEAVGLEE